MRSLQDEKPTTKLRFPMRLLYLLRETSKNPGIVGTVGIGWYKDRRSFICNTRLLGEYFKLRQNSINANFRDHGFDIVESKTSDIIEMHGVLPDIQNWKRRRHRQYQISPEMSDADVDKIRFTSHVKTDLIRDSPCLELSERFNVSAIKDAISTMLPQLFLNNFGNDVDLFISFAHIARNIATKQNNRIDDIECIVKEWMSFFGKEKFVPYGEVARHIGVDDVLLRAFVEIVNFRSPHLQQTLDVLTLYDYALLRLRFGMLEQLASVFYEVAEVCGNKVRLKGWFRPDLSPMGAVSYLEMENEESWLVIFSNTLDSFLLCTKRVDKGDGILLKIRIRMSTTTNERFLQCEGDYEQPEARSFLDIATNVLNLRQGSNTSNTIPFEDSSMMTATVEQIAAREKLPSIGNSLNGSQLFSLSTFSPFSSRINSLM